MIKQSMLILCIMFVLSIYISPVLAQGVPDDTDQAVIQYIQQEHKTTRKFTSDEIARQRTQFNEDFEDRAEYYKNEADDLITQAVWKLGLIWGGIVFLIFGLSNFLSRRLERRKWTKMLDSAKAEVLQAVKEEDKKVKVAQDLKKTELDHKEQELIRKESMMSAQSKRLEEAKPALIKMHQRLKKQQEQMKKIMGDMDLR